MKNKVGNIDIETSTQFYVGNDIVFLPDFEKTFSELFKKKVYTENEISYCNQFDNSFLRYASTWAAKEAVYKAVKQNSTEPLPFNTIEISRNKVAGKPIAHLLKWLNQPNISLSISHDGDYVWAIAIISIN
ncbi:holo-ACP synthase [Pedobacter aquatilis]|uniref:holo-ACP synthase n=1 Tax=Pedobacter aquatilis TaxID=351343 RepID=UPI0025B5B21A|nr:holo-ACP synthase [Pedobacter aquatilis]MDN3588944.1 holo-ACP synthase [Pedobacter aquatilis]